MIEIKVKNPEEMANLAQKIAKIAQKNDIIGLEGTLGAGKSFFAAAFINSLLEQKQEITSPTFNLVYSYSTKSGEIFHFDLYRIKSENDLYNIGIEDAINEGITLIEWPAIAKNFCHKNFLEINIKIDDEFSRIVTLNPDDNWNKKLKI
jgi:tRNA threonylcarbamoyladenosine biosynthesis protein TsaE